MWCVKFFISIFYPVLSFKGFKTLRYTKDFEQFEVTAKSLPSLKHLGWSWSGHGALPLAIKQQSERRNQLDLRVQLELQAPRVQRDRNANPSDLSSW